MKNEWTRVMACMVAGSALVLGACGETSRIPAGADVGPQPRLVGPQSTLLPTVKVAKAVGWSDGTIPNAAQGLQVRAFAKDLDHPRWLAVLPNGDVLVAESNAPERPESRTGLKGWVMKRGDVACWCRRSERRSHHALAGCRCRWRSRDPQCLSRRTQLAVRHGPGRRCPLCRAHRRCLGVSLQGR